MKTLQNKGRWVLCLLIIAAFFLPGYNGYSGYQFVSASFEEVAQLSGVTSTDVVIAVVPLVMIPVTALVLWLFVAVRFPIRRIYVGLPLLFLLFFTGILLAAEKNGQPVSSPFAILARLEVGFYTALLCSLLLPYTRNPKRKARYRRHAAPVETEGAV